MHQCLGTPEIFKNGIVRLGLSLGLGRFRELNCALLRN